MWGEEGLKIILFKVRLLMGKAVRWEEIKEK
jgi:hypothetical protein